MLQNILSELSPRLFYERVLGKTLPEENEKGDVFIQCPFHERFVGKPDETASMSVSLAPDRAGVFQCFGCKARGTLIKFFELYNHLDDLPQRKVLEKLVEQFGLDPTLLKRELIDEETLADWTNALYNTPEGKTLLAHIIEKRFLSRDIISEFRLGLHHNGRLAIPIFEADGTIVNVRQWLPEYKRLTDRDKRHKMLGIAGANSPRLYPYIGLRQQDIILCEGELDALALRTLGFNGVTNSASVELWPKHWDRYFADKNIVIIFDTDGVSVNTADELLLRLTEVTRNVKVVNLKREITQYGYDITDFITDVGKDNAAQSLRALIESVPWFYIKSETDAQYTKVNLYSAANADVIGKHIEVQAKVTGKEPEPFAIPKKITCTCFADKPNKRCPGCPLVLFGESTVTKEIETDSAMVIDLLQSGRDQIKVLKEWFQVGCTTGSFRIDQYINVEDMRLMPEMTVGADAYEHVIRNAYYTGYGLRMNQTYIFRGKTLIDPVTQRVTHVFDQATPVDTITQPLQPTEEIEIDGLTKTVKEHLSIFQPKPGQEIREKLYDIYLDFEVNVARIWHRKDLIQAYDLTYHSPIHFNFGDEYIHQGWISTLVIGDTQCGKTKTLLALQQHFNAGLVLSGEAVTRVGIMGGFIDIPGRRGAKFMLGAFPLNDGKLVAIDEFSGLKPEEIGELTLLRSYGKSIVTKQAQHYEHPARVRTIMLSNPRDGRSIGSFGQGCEAIQKLIGTDADTARFDIFVVVATEEVPLNEINSMVVQDIPHVYTQAKCNLLLNWVWTRKASDYEFSMEARKRVFEAATEMAEQYDPAIPIVVAGSHRWTVARIAAAIAARLYSTDETGRKVMVEAEHVDAAKHFLYDCYNKPSMGYHIFSARRRREHEVLNPELVKKWLEDWPWQVSDQLLQLGIFTRSELANVTGLDDFAIKEIVSNLIKVGAIRSHRSNFYLNKGFKSMLENFKHPQYGKVYEKFGEDLEGDATIPVNFD